MTRQYSTALRNGWNNLYESAIGPSPHLQIFSGTLPVSCASPDDGDLLIDLELPSDWMSSSDQGTIAKNGVWATTALASGIATYYRLKSADLVTVHEQGVVGVVGPTGIDLIMNSTSVEIGQSVSVNNWSITAPGQ